MALTLVTVDVGNTLLQLSGAGVASALLARMPEGADRERLRERLLTERLSREQIEELSGLRLPASNSTATLEPETARALRDLRTRATVVTLSNTTALDAAGVDPLAAAFPDLPRFRSCDLGVAKPDPAAFEAAIAGGGATAADTVHIGDSWTCDVLGAAAVGVRSIWIGDPTNLPGPAPTSMIGIARTFAQSVELLTTGA